MAASPKRLPLVVGLDFGTTFSGASWYLCDDESDEPQDPEVIRDWDTDRSNTHEAQKVPSKIYYDVLTDDIYWGYEIPDDVEPFEWFKLLLLEQEDLQAHLRDSFHLRAARRKLKDSGKTAVEIVGDYLGKLWSHVLMKIMKTEGAIIDAVPFHVVLTVPAIWKDYTRDRMRLAAKRAGIMKNRAAGPTVVSFISEPEAAAFATTHEHRRRGNLKAGDTFVVVDAGGGTVDVISYKIEVPKPLVVTECVEGDGDLCGASFVDEKFEARMIREISLPTWKSLSRPQITAIMKENWEDRIKRKFDGSTKSWTIQLPSPLTQRDPTLTAHDIEQLFSAVLPKIRKLVKDQLREILTKTAKHPKFIILVGGFGRSAYLYKCLKEWLGDRPTELLESKDAWSAICRGATLSGAMSQGLVKQTVQVRSRIARASYGWCYATNFIEGVHDKRDKRWDEYDGEWVAWKQMTWAVKRGDDISTRSSKSESIYHQFDCKKRGIQSRTTEIYVCHDERAPSRQDKCVQLFASVSWKTPVPVETLPLGRGAGIPHYRFTLDFKMEVSGAAADFFISHNGIQLASKNISVAHE
ncbi:Uu.00g113980.m01.CDS01 [Anthostomella pinea]|uniref:Uu.00g113980.m01.CDS01 n=1 Tax=Anthostomella pinea TaxID=933095 RepID=A0AAI8YGL0_9PEZI|nr:Uu.00g113980.m01.CDS01 [Anthostomella pinea]